MKKYRHNTSDQETQSSSVKVIEAMIDKLDASLTDALL